jgi:hypothetical protein
MSFLLRLARKTLGHSAPIRPLIAPRFAEVAPPISPQEELGTEQETTFTEATPAAAASRSVFHEPPGPPPALLVEDVAPAPPSLRGSTPAPETPARLAEALRGPARESPQAAESSVERAALQTPTLPRSMPALVVERARDGSTRAESRAPSSLPSAPSPAVPPSTVGARESATVSLFEPLPEPEASSAPATAPAFAVDNEQRLHSRLSGARAAPASVHVTIGRVEVRAVMPAPAARPAATAPTPARSPLSLDEYLRALDRRAR